MLRDVNYFFVHKAFEGGWKGLMIFSRLFEVHRLIAELPEMVFGIVLVPVGKELEQAKKPFFTSFGRVFGNGSKDLFG
jgi:hypothetical protein